MNFSHDLTLKFLNHNQFIKSALKMKEIKYGKIVNKYYLNFLKFI
ncbi:protein of unknown function [Legionella micdadei]|uniref:Uncharacterized protein n=1 Tax=Legionella micdadei TaxID=451 RepID=A0A098GB29_LEGMI|nr:protein of unknown function [Legionella micdadei]